MAHLTAVQVPFDGDRPPGVREDTDGHHYAYFRDPDGNRVEVVTFLADEDGPVPANHEML